jgi:hypothetical protein
MIERILRTPAEVFQEIAALYRINGKVRTMLIQSSLCFALYGAVMGLPHSPQQALFAAIKLPALYLLTLAICMPALYFFNILLGSRMMLPHVMGLMLTAITATAALAASLAPISLFFWVSGRDYGFFLLINVAFLALTGAIGLTFLTRGLRHIDPSGELIQRRRQVLLMWITLYAFVGTQMAWTLRPFVNVEMGKDAAFLREFSGNFYSAVWYSFWGLFR